ncbi:MAG: type I glutamate--ammonia ligase [Chloroflexi bacterium]|nr:type I glutamate--ammonia ligase [Chloroflexota bacterium]
MDGFHPKLAEVTERIEQEGIRFIILQFTDVLGLVKSVSIPVHQFGDAVRHGKWFDGSSIEGFARIAESDMFLRPDLDTFALIPWSREEAPTARVICWVHSPTGEIFPGDPRAVLNAAVQEARQLGYVFNTGPELEFFLFNLDDRGQPAPLPHDRGSYFDYSTDQAAHVRNDMVEALQKMGIRVETSHHEVAVGQHEIDFEYADALRTADNTVTFKYTLKAVAQRHGLHATFMPKPIFGIAGSGMHTHQSLASVESGDNLFADPGAPYGLSDLAKHFIAGQLHHARAMSAVLAPTVNSYKRLVPGFEAPVYVSWARVNRSALIRVPRISPGQPKATRIELRCPDPACSPYLAFAVMLKCGLDGIKRRLPIPEPIEENLYNFDDRELERRAIAVLPGTLKEALDELRKDTVVQEALGEHIYDRFMEAKIQEWDDYRRYVSPWEIERFLEVY